MYVIARWQREAKWATSAERGEKGRLAVWKWLRAVFCWLPFLVARTRQRELPRPIFCTAASGFQPSPTTLPFFQFFSPPVVSLFTRWLNKKNRSGGKGGGGETSNPFVSSLLVYRHSSVKASNHLTTTTGTVLPWNLEQIFSTWSEAAPKKNLKNKRRSQPTILNTPGQPHFLQNRFVGDKYTRKSSPLNSPPVYIFKQKDCQSSPPPQSLTLSWGKGGAKSSDCHTAQSTRNTEIF